MTRMIFAAMLFGCAVPATEEVKQETRCQLDECPIDDEGCGGTIVSVPPSDPLSMPLVNSITTPSRAVVHDPTCSYSRRPDRSVKWIECCQDYTIENPDGSWTGGTSCCATDGRIMLCGSSPQWWHFD